MAQTKRALSAALAVLLIFSLAACGGGNTQTSGGGSTSDAPKILNIHIDVEAASLRPQIATDGTSFEVIASFLEGLYSIDGAGTPYPCIAESYEMADDGLEYIFKLRDAQWSNGDPVTAHDFVFAWRLAVDPETASEYAYIIDTAGVKNAAEIANGDMAVDSLGISAVDDKTLKIELAFPVPYFLPLMSFPTFYPVNQKFYEECGENFATAPEYLLANGPFKVTSFQQMATSIDLVKNETYYNADQVLIDGLHYQVIKDSQQAMLSYQNGDLHIATLSGEQSENFASDPEYTPIMAGYLWFISPNTEVEGLGNVNLRRAMALSFDKSAIVNNILKDGSIVADFAVPSQFATGPDGKDYRATSATYLSTNKDLAKEYFETAKEELGMDTFSYAMLVEDTESALNVAQFLKAQIEENLPGLTIAIESMPKATRLNRMEGKDYELGLTRWGPDYADPMTYLDLWITGAQNNFGNWTNARYDEIIASAKSGDLAVDPEARGEALKEAEAIIMDEAGNFPIYQKGNAELVKSTVKGIEWHSVGLNRVFKNVTIAD
jgi:oligopeptide transport system substrate-binding protein